MLRRKRKDRFKSKYMDIDFDSMSDEEFEKVSKRIYKSIAIRGLVGMFLFIICIVALVLCGRYLW